MVFSFLRPVGEKCTALAPEARGELGRVAVLAAGPCPESPLARHRTGWTARLDLPDLGPCCLKVYHHPGLETLKGALRTTFLAPSRVRREVAALQWLRRHDLGGPAPLAWGERRCLGWLRRGWILMEYLEAPDLARHLAEHPDRAAPLLALLGTWLARVHALGLEDRNPHLRNFLVEHPGSDTPRLHKIDSPKARIHDRPLLPGQRERDLETLRRDARRLGLDLEPFERSYREAHAS